MNQNSEKIDLERSAWLFGECHPEHLRRYEGKGDFEYHCPNPSCGNGINCTEETATGDAIYECVHCGNKLKVIL